MIYYHIKSWHCLILVYYLHYRTDPINTNVHKINMEGLGDETLKAF